MCVCVCVCVIILRVGVELLGLPMGVVHIGNGNPCGTVCRNGSVFADGTGTNHVSSNGVYCNGEHCVVDAIQVGLCSHHRCSWHMQHAQALVPLISV